MKKQHGFTLIELMITTIILVTIAGIGLPALIELISRHNIQTTAPFFARSIQLARTEAIKRGVTVRVRSKDSTSNWSNGWLIEHGTVLNPTLIREFDPLPGTPVFTSNLNNTNLLEIMPNGQTDTTGDFEIYYVHCSGLQRVKYTLLISGILKKELSACPP